MDKNKAVFLDRDGVINKDTGYVHKIEDFLILPGVIESLKILQSKGYKLIIVTNQGGIAKKYYTLDDFTKLNNHMLSIFEENKIKIEKVYFCPHAPEEDCECRKPKTKFVYDAEKEFNIDLKNSWVIGDKMSDIKMGEDCGCRALLVESEYVKNVDVMKFKDIYDCANYILVNSVSAYE